MLLHVLGHEHAQPERRTMTLMTITAVVEVLSRISGSGVAATVRERAGGRVAPG
ncbi:hypothetical protein AB4305_22490 [Nocardia sp. 2YAB30]|uniref:hypothetical protein n=1 Tax=unclassified Nocardia TaxID=2637762 RepID=UPI003F959C85